MSTALVTHQMAFELRWIAHWCRLMTHPAELRSMRKKAMEDLERPAVQAELKRIYESER